MQGLIECILLDFAKFLELGLFEEMISVNASKHLFASRCVARRTRRMEWLLQF